jgi:hypothetical protein
LKLAYSVAEVAAGVVHTIADIMQHAKEIIDFRWGSGCGRRGSSDV